MRFRKNSIMFMEYIVMCCLTAIVCIALIPIDLYGVLPYVSLVMILFLTLAPAFYDEYITIDNEGIACTRRKELMWEYRWDDVLYLRKSLRYRAPSIEIVTEDHSDAPITYDYSKHYFQLGRTAKKALRQCCVPNNKAPF